MKEVIFIILLLVGVAISVGGVLVLLRLKKRTGEVYVTHQLLVLVFLTAFSLYNLWGRGFITYFLVPAGESDLLNSIRDFFGYLGLPFLLAAWPVVIRFEGSIRNKYWPKWAIIFVMALFATLLILAGTLSPDIHWHQLHAGTLGAITAGINLSVFFYAGISLIIFRQETSAWAESRPVFWLGFALLLEGMMQVPAHALQGYGFWVESAFLLLFFISLILPLVIITWSPLIRRRPAMGYSDIKGFKSFCKEYEISPREAEVILEICKGKTNKEISDSLFISLQTVKDHAHRIFSKTGVRSRVQLVNLAKEWGI